MPPGRASASWVQAWTTLAAVGLLMALPQWARAETCLPSLAEEGRRLSEMPEPSTFWLELLLRQHEACRVAKGPHEDVRVFVYGSTPVMGYPGPAAESVTEQLNFFWRQQGLRAHAFNFAFGAGHATKDMLIVRESLRYRPDVIVYGMTPADLTRGLAHATDRRRRCRSCGWFASCAAARRACSSSQRRTPPGFGGRWRATSASSRVWIAAGPARGPGRCERSSHTSTRSSRRGSAVPPSNSGCWTRPA
jgi:hypothetical protein